MQSHADPLVERVLRDTPRVSFLSAGDVPDWRDGVEREVQAEQGFSASTMDRLMKEAAHRARAEERRIAEVAEDRARDGAYSAGLRDGVEAGVAGVRRALRRDGALANLRALGGAISELREALDPDSEKLGEVVADYLLRVETYLAAVMDEQR